MDAVEEIKSRLAIEEIVGRYVDLKRSGAGFKGLCPFHQEKTPSFYVTPSRGTFHCFGCGRGGDIFTFVMEADRLPFADALKQLAEQAGVGLPDRDPGRRSFRNRLYEANESALRFFREALASSQGAKARDYLAGRGFYQDAIDLFDLGYGPAGRDGLVRHLRAAGFDDALQLAAGLAIQDDIGGQLRDRFRGRLMFPIRDASGRIGGFGGRTLEDAQPKYLNSPQTETFDKSSVLYGVHRAAEAIRQAGRAVLVEGYLDALRAHLEGYPFTVASLGTAVTTQQLAALARMTDSVVLALDPDPAGRSAAARTTLNALAEVTAARGRAPGAAGALDLRIAQLPEGEGDPDELIRDDPELWRRTIDEAVPAFEYFFTQTMEALDRTEDGWRQEAIDRLLPLIQQFSGSAGWQATWVQRLAQLTGIDPRALQRSIPQVGAPKARPTRRAEAGGNQDVVTGTTSRALAADPAIEVEQAMVALLLKLMVLPAELDEHLDAIRFDRLEHRTIVTGLREWSAKRNYDYLMFRETLPEDVREVADELRARELPVPAGESVPVAVALHAARLRHFRLLAQLERVTHTLGELAPEDRSAAMSSLATIMSEQHEVDQTLDRLSRLVVQAGKGAPQGTIDQEAGSW